MTQQINLGHKLTMNVKVFQLLLVFTDDINRLFEGYTLDSMFTKNVIVPTYILTIMFI